MHVSRPHLLGQGVARLLAAAALIVATSAHSATLQDNVTAMQDTNAEAGAAQKNIANLQAQTQSMVEEYKRLTATVDYQEQYSQEMQDRLASQNKELASLRTQMASRQTIQDRIVPLMRSMSDALEQIRGTGFAFSSRRAFSAHEQSQTTAFQFYFVFAR